MAAFGSPQSYWLATPTEKKDPVLYWLETTPLLTSSVTWLNIAIRANFFPIGQFFDGIYLPLGNILCTLGKKISKLINY